MYHLRQLSFWVFAKSLRIFEIYVIVNNSLCGKLVSSSESPITYNGWFKITFVPFSISDFNLLSCYIILKQNKFTKLLQLLVKNPK